MRDQAIVIALTGDEFLDWAVGIPLRVLLIVVGAFLVSRIAGRAIRHSLARIGQSPIQERIGAATLRPEERARMSKRVDALTTVLTSVAAIAIWLIAALLVLAELGIDIAPLLAGAGVVGLALGFGAQSLVKDFLAGTFILIEDQFGVGDVVDVGEATGTVEAVSLRVTRLRAIDGTVWYVPNGEIQRVGNMSQHWSRALIDVEVAYDTDLARAKEVIKRVADELAREDDRVLDEPEIWGVEALGASAIAIRLVVKTLPAEQFPVSRLLRERIKEAFDREGIEIPFPQQTVWMHVEQREAEPPSGTAEAG
jgi:small-conductance mechanosensitive channel